MTVHQYDIVLDVTVINRTGDTLQNLCLELATMGDLKLVERPQNYTLGPGATRTVRCAAPGPPWPWLDVLKLLCLGPAACWQRSALQAHADGALCRGAMSTKLCAFIKLDSFRAYTENGRATWDGGIYVSLSAWLRAKLPSTLSSCHAPTVWRRSWALEPMMLCILCRANIKVSSTETGAIFGNVVYETTGASERSVVRLLCPAHAALAGHMRPEWCHSHSLCLAPWVSGQLPCGSLAVPLA